MWINDDSTVSQRPTVRYRESVTTPRPAEPGHDTLGPDGDPLGPGFLTVPAPPPLPVELRGDIPVPALEIREVAPAARPRRDRLSIAIAIAASVVFGVVAASVVAPRIDVAPTAVAPAADARIADALPGAATATTDMPPSPGPAPSADAPAPEAPMLEAPTLEAPMVEAPTTRAPAAVTRLDAEGMPEALLPLTPAIAPVVFEAPRRRVAPSPPEVAEAAPPVAAEGREDLGGLRALRAAPRARDEGQVAEQVVRQRRAAEQANAGPLSAQAVRRVITAQQPRLRQCYTTAIRRLGTPMDARVQLTIEIHPAGHVSDVILDGTDLPFMNQCIENSARRWRFPASSDGGRVPMPLSFTAAL